MKKNKLVAMTMVATLTVGGSVSAFAQGQGFGGAQRSNTLGQEQRGERPEAVDGELAERPERADKGADFTATLTDAGIDLEAFKELSKEEQATVLAEAGFEVPTMTERADKGERTEMTERTERPTPEKRTTSEDGTTSKKDMKSKRVAETV